MTVIIKTIYIVSIKYVGNLFSVSSLCSNDTSSSEKEEILNSFHEYLIVTLVKLRTTDDG